MPSPKSIILSSTATAWISRLTRMLVTFFTLPIIMAQIGVEKYGIWVLVGQTISLLSLTDAGVTNSVGRFVAKYRGRNDFEGVQQTISNASFFLLMVGLFIGAFVFALSPFVSKWVGVPEASADLAKTVFLITGLNLALSTPLRIGEGILAGHQRYVFANLTQIFEAIILAGGILALVGMSGLTLMSYTVVNALSLTFPQLIALGYIRIYFPKLLPKLSQVTREKLRELIGFGTSSLTITFSSMIYRQGLVIAAGHFLGPSAVGVYGVVQNIMTLVSALLTQVSAPILTLGSELKESGGLKKLHGTILGAMNWTFFLALLFLVGVLLFKEDFFRIFFRKSDWTNEDYAMAGNAFLVMSVGMAIGIPMLTVRNAFVGIGGHWVVAKRVVWTSILSLGVGLILMVKGFGILGPSWGWASMFILQGVVFFPPLAKELLNIRYQEMIFKVYLPATGVAILAYGSCRWMNLGLDVQEPSQFIIEAAVFLLVATFFAAVVGKGVKRWVRH